MIQAHVSGSGFGQRGGFLGSVKRVIALVAALGVGALVLFAAGVVAIATAIVGVIIAFVAMLLRFGAYGGRNRRAASKDNAEHYHSETGNPTVIDARRTARGWTVDG